MSSDEDVLELQLNNAFTLAITKMLLPPPIDMADACELSGRVDYRNRTAIDMERK